jgi:hypothetical protein
MYPILIAMALLLIGILYYITKPKLSKVICWNGNDDRRNRGFEGVAFPEYATKNRIPGIVAEIKEKTTTGVLFCLFEMEFETCEDIVVRLGRTYATTTVPYNTSKGSFNFLLITLHPEFLTDVTRCPLTRSGKSFVGLRPDAPKSGELPSDEFKRYKEEVLFDNFDKMVIRISFDDVDVYITHLGLSTDARMAQTEKLVELVRSYSVHFSRNWIVCGDLNSFDPSSTNVYMPQINKLHQLGGSWLTEAVSTTFSAFKFDIAFKLDPEEKKKYFGFKDLNDCVGFREFCLEMAEKYGTDGGPLDHVFTSGDISAKALVHFPSELSDHSLVEVLLD